MSQSRSISKPSRSRQRVAASLSRSRSRGMHMNKCHLSRSRSVRSVDSKGSRSPVSGMSAGRKRRVTCHSRSLSKSRGGHGSCSPPSRLATRDSVTPRREISESPESKASSHLQSTPRSPLSGSLSPTSPADDLDVEESSPVQRDEFNFWEPTVHLQESPQADWQDQLIAQEDQQAEEQATHMSSPDASTRRKPEVTQDCQREQCSFWGGSMQDPAPECESILSNFMKNVTETPGLSGCSSDKDDDHSPDMPPGVWTESTTTLLHGAAPLQKPPGSWGPSDDVVAPRSCSPLKLALTGCKKQGSALSASKLFAKAVGGLAGQTATKRVAPYAKPVDGSAGQAATKRVATHAEDVDNSTGQAAAKRVAPHAKDVDGFAGQAGTKRVGNIRRSSLGGA